jgi:adenine-specific DNA-methyltransferase
MINKTAHVYSDTTEINIFEDGNQLKLEYNSVDKFYSLQRNNSTSVDTNLVYRPIQYLGSKYRSLPIILSKTLESVIPGTYVLDMFSGSSVVSQVFNLNRLNVISNDALRFNSSFAKALLNIDRASEDIGYLTEILEDLKNYQLDEVYLKPFQDKIILENELLKNRNTEQLLLEYQRLPQVNKVWDLKENEPSEQIKSILNNIGKSAIGSFPLIANYYAGTYFSLFQSLELDRLRNGIEVLQTQNRISNWLYNFLLTCLLNVSSKIVYSAGKHFAQPIKQENTIKTAVLHKRFYNDRQKNVWDEFVKSLFTLETISKANNIATKNIVYSKTMEEIIKDSSNLPPVSVIYADPPYTAQQYSRYYHIPEVIFNYQYPQLQIVDGKATSGLYPDNKFKSRFCSKREAYSAFSDLFKLSAEVESSLVLSYSSSLSEETGNMRMIELDQIIDLGSSILPMCSIEILKFNFQYRQLNTSKKINQAKDDKEFLIVFKQPSK